MENNPAMKEIVKQIGNLALSLKNFENENISKIEKNQSLLDQFNQMQQKMKTDFQKLKQEVDRSFARQDEAEQSFLQSFQDIKNIVLTKLNVFDRQIESKEELEKIH